MNAGRRNLAMAALAAAALPSIALSARGPTILMRFSIVASAGSPRGRAATKFKQIIEARTEGSVRVEIFFDSTLYAQRDELQALQLAAAQIVCANLHAFSSLGLSDFEAFELPYLFDSYRSLRSVTDGPAGARLLAQLQEKGLEGLGFWDVGFKQFSANRALRVPEDARGMSIRITYSRVSDLEMRVLGAIPQPMSLAETRAALASGALDATELPAHLIATNRLDDVQPYLTVSNHAYIGSVLVANRRFWEKLPAELRAAIADAAREASAFANAAAEKEDGDAIASLAARGRMRVLTLTDAERRRWKQALMPVHRDSEDRIPAPTLHAIYDAAGFVPE
jgi:C4-dicarboxylate-binding protein DctP